MILNNKNIKLIILFLFIPNILFSAKTLEQKLKEITNKLSKQKQTKKQTLNELIKLGSDIEYKQKKIQNISLELNDLEKKIFYEKNVINTLENKINELENIIQNKSKNIKIYKKELNQQIKYMNLRLKSIFKQFKKFGGLYKLYYLINTDNYVDLRKNIKLITNIAEFDRKLIDKFLYLITILENETENLEKVKSEKLKVMEKHKNKINELNKLINEKQTIKNKIVSDKKQLQSEIEYRKRQMKIIDAAINNLVEQLEKTDALIKFKKTEFKKKKGRLFWPIDKKSYNTILSEYNGRNNKYFFSVQTDGIEIKCKLNQDVKSVADGVTIFAGWIDAFGKTVIVSHGGGYVTLYSHLNEINVNTGDEIEMSQVIGKAGDSASLFGTSLFFQIRENKKPVNPLKWLKK